MKKEEKDQSGYKPNETYQDLESGYHAHYPPVEEAWEDKFGMYDTYARASPAEHMEIRNSLYVEKQQKEKAAQLTISYLSALETRVTPELLGEYMNTIFNFINK